MVKEDVENFYKFHFSLLFYSNFLFTFIYQSFVKVNWQTFFEFLVLAGGDLFL